MPRIVAYSLCYQEGALLCLAIRQVYDLVDEFRVVIGSSDVRPKGHPRGWWAQPDDTTSEAILRAMPDPLNKLRIVPGRFKQWTDKQAMTDAALEGITDAIVLQLDADEFWPTELLKHCLSVFGTDPHIDSVAVPHVLFWGDCEHICRTGDGSDVWFKPPRLFRLTPNRRIRHLMPALVDKSTNTDVPNGCVVHTPLRHAAWIGDARVLRKRAFYVKGRGIPMFSVEDWKNRNTLPPDRVLQINVGPMTVAPTPEEYLPPADLRKEIEKAASLPGKL
jgi:hypothetical protein